MRLVINNLHPGGTCKARSWINDWPEQNHSCGVSLTQLGRISRMSSCWFSVSSCRSNIDENGTSNAHGKEPSVRVILDARSGEVLKCWKHDRLHDANGFGARRLAVTLAVENTRRYNKELR